MFISQAPLKTSPLWVRSSERSQALVVVLAMVVIASVLVLAFFAAVRFDLTATSSYGQSLKAEQLGLGGLQLVVGQLQQEMAKDCAADAGGTLGANTLYTNVTSANIMPQSVGTNATMLSLLKISTNAAFFTGTLNNGALQATTINSGTPSLNGRSISVARWSHAYMGDFPNSASTPNWVLITRAGPTNFPGSTAVYGNSTANAVNNPNLANDNYVLGRIAYAVYDEGGLLDITAAGYTNSALTTDQLQTLKGTLAGADVTQVGVDPVALTAWRNAGSGANVSSFLYYITNTVSTNGFLKVATGDRTFLGRQDLIKAAQSGTAGLTAGALTNLATFTRESTLPSWGPSANAVAGGIYNYARNANISTAAPFSTTSRNPNRFIPRICYSATATVTSYHSDGLSYTYGVQSGDALLQHRFPLDRINWLGPTGPNAAAGGTAANIQACFGLRWAVANDTSMTGAAYNVWQYVGPSGITEQSMIETLDQVASEGREPNFFELLQAGILTGSIGVSGDVTGASATYSFQYKNALQIFRIGASVIDQYDSDSYPTVVEYNQSGSYWQAVGMENLPNVNLCKAINGASEVANTQAAVYFLFGLWNPNQQPVGVTITRPDVRLHFKGTIYVGNEWGNYSGFNYRTGGPSYLSVIDTTIPLVSGTAGVGVNGFTTPNLLLPADVASVSTPGATGNAWSATPAGAFSLEPLAANQYVGYRLPDFLVSPIKQVAGNYQLNNSVPVTSGWSTAGNNWDNLQIASTSQSSTGVVTDYPAQYDLQYKDASGNWVPYSIASGLNDSANTWSGSKIYLQGCKVNQGANYYDPPTFATLESTFSGTGVQMTSDPRSVRFNLWSFIRNAIRPVTPTALNALITSLWPLADGTTSSNYVTYGYGGGYHPGNGLKDSTVKVNGTTADVEASSIPPLFLGTVTTTADTSAYFPAQLARNNRANGVVAATPITGYVDNDGVQRIADSGLFVGSAANNFSPSTGNPYQRDSDKPLILNRPFNSVAEMGYAFRDDPWKSLNFFSADSADSGLLDLFSVHETPPVITPGQTMQAARLNLNTRNPAVLAAILRGAVIDTAPGTKTTISATQANALASAIIGATATAPLLNKDQLVTKLGPQVATTSPPTIVEPLAASAFASTDDQNIKTHREAYVRALAEVGQTRTWNLMIDLIAQSGKYPPSANNLEQFVVEGERRYWLHIAIDRFTGQVIAQQLEPVTE